ncbi:MAG: bifunctional pyr operon transcriptional regulator/uracil phosphoribosyltransferase PyrR [Planctomycetales bacterium]|nr:bifunctional pyr operon transcriptional regulator/uracil phosphoribosyltransferase PyrR [Planctomycetales bacterium]
MASAARRICGPEEVAADVRRVAEGVLRRGEARDLALVGIRTRGDVLAVRLRDAIRAAGGPEAPVGSLDITLYRDDLATSHAVPVVRGTEVRFDVTGRRLLLVDDVLYTGRTVRAALTELADLGRPRRIELAVLVDRGERELPIAADHVGREVRAGAGEEVAVLLREVDGRDEIVVRPVPGREPR